MINVMKPYFSIIMTVYNSEHYLRRAINSVLQQKFNDFELIIVNDCSTDASKKICLEYTQLDTRVVFKHTDRNLGVANARNVGLAYASGQYITFVDSDDFIAINLLIEVQKILFTHKVEVLKYGCVEDYYDNDKLIGSKKISLSNQYITSDVEVKKKILDLEEKPLFGYVWNTFYDMKFLRAGEYKFDLRYVINEDFMFNLNVFSDAKYLYCMGKCCYHYIKRGSKSLSSQKNSSYYELQLAKIYGLLAKYKEWKLLNSNNLKRIFWLYTRYTYAGISRKIVEDGIQGTVYFLNNIFLSNVFHQYKFIKFTDFSIKKKVLINVLQSKNKYLIILSCMFMNLIKKKFRIFFAFIKR